jgi:hypothetical protein
MIDLTLDDLAQLDHVAWGYLIVTFLCLMFHAPLDIVVPIAFVAAAGKEYWDCHGLEPIADSGGISGSWKDFIFWSLGILIGAFVSLYVRP